MSDEKKRQAREAELSHSHPSHLDQFGRNREIPMIEEIPSLKNIVSNQKEPEEKS